MRELALQADLIRYPSDLINIRIEKFAALIVRECAEICLEANDHKNILRHFGVEHD
jgi:hypothetical protein